MFLSEVYDGRISDKDITRRSGIIEKVEPGDSIMADRGFDISDMLPEVSFLMYSLFQDIEINWSQLKFCLEGGSQHFVYTLREQSNA